MTRKFGWCLTGHHDTCVVKYDDWNGQHVVCSCDCHVAKERE